jgi:molybdopterin synthase catalytic subunit
MIELTENPIDFQAAIDSVRSPAAGAVVLFLGTARETTAGRTTRSLEYEAYPEMARAKLAELESEARRRWPLVACAVVHRLGHVAIGEVSVAIAVSSAHREAAFEAGQWLIDRIKEVVPIWKKENWADGTSEWVHPGLEKVGTSEEPCATASPEAVQHCSQASRGTRPDERGGAAP